MALNISCDNILEMGNQLRDIECLYMKYAEKDVKNFLYSCKNHEYSFTDSILCDFWNRGYPIKVTKVFLRKSDKSVMVGGINAANNKEDDEFFSYMMNFRQMQHVIEHVIPSFYN